MLKQARHLVRDTKIKYKNNTKHTRSGKVKLKPGIDSRLKKVFALIGKPEPRPFKPDRFQLESLEAIKTADCLVTAPTSAGKTWIAQEIISSIFHNCNSNNACKAGGKAWYATPLKALTNAKYNEFSNQFGAKNVGILTGDRKENQNAPIIVGTTEILRNQLYDAMHNGQTLLTDLVVLDEAHYLGDEDRGVVWEEIMIYLPPRVSLLMLSATIGNADNIAKWLSSIRKNKCFVIKETKRPVPLFPLFLHPSGTVLPLIGQQNHKEKTKISPKVAKFINSTRPVFLAPPRQLPPFGEILKILQKYNLLPGIFFLKSRADCNKSIDLCSKNLILNSQQKKRLCKRVDELIAKNAHIKNHSQIWHLKNLAVGAHHSGQLPAWKIVLETLMSEGLLNAIFATSTVAAGVNFPARTIVFLNSDRFNGKEFLPLSSTEFHQMTGRAGRRGLDKIGFAMAIPGKFMDIRHTAKLVNMPSSDIHSQIKISFSMVLNLLLSHTPSQIENLLDKSFATYLIKIKKRNKKIDKETTATHKNLVKDFTRHLNFLKEERYVTFNGELTDDGLWASKLRVDQPLLIAEGFRNNIFPQSDPGLLAALMGSFVNDQITDDRIDKSLVPKKMLTTFFMVKKHLKPFTQRMISHGFEVSPLLLKPAVSIYAWALGKTWDKILLTADIAEGDMVMLILRTIDNLRHINSLDHVFPQASKTATESINLLFKDPVVTHIK